MSPRQRTWHGGSRDTREVEQFAREFQSEARLREVTAQLLQKMHYTGVTLTHDANEKGKDIVFYEQDPLRGTRLGACVVKNERITGAVGTRSGAATVFQQAMQALMEPYTNLAYVYVISPYTNTPAAVESIKNQLQDKAGQVVFKCGPEFIQLFHEWWPDFLRFESSVLTRYLASLSLGLAQDPAFSALLARQNVDDGARSLASVYVQPKLRQELAVFSLSSLGLNRPFQPDI